MISSVVALQTALARPWPARLCLAARIRSLRVCPPAVCISDEVAGCGAVLAAIWNWYPECCGCIYPTVWCDGVCVWCVMGLAALGPTWQQQQLSPAAQYSTRYSQHSTGTQHSPLVTTSTTPLSKKPRNHILTTANTLDTCWLAPQPTPPPIPNIPHPPPAQLLDINTQSGRVLQPTKDQIHKHTFKFTLRELYT